MGILLGLNAILWLAGFALPLPCFLVAGYRWIKTKSIPTATTWRRRMSLIAFVALTFGLGFWIYALVRLHRGDDLFGSLTAYTGAAGAALLIIPSALAESKIRIWLILGALGLLFFFAFSAGEVAI